MGCDKLKPPEVPKVDPSKLPTGVSLPGGKSPAEFAAAAGKNATLSNAVKGAENLIDKNIKNATNALNPEKIGEAIGGAIAGVANTITDAVDGAIAGVTGLTDKISKLGKLPPALPPEINSPEAIVGSIKPKLGALDMSALKQKKKCAEEYLKKAGEKNAAMKEKAEAAAAKLTSAQKKAMEADPKEKERVQADIQNKVAEEMKEELVEEQKTKPPEDKSVQDSLHAEKIAPAKRPGEFDPEFTDMLLQQMSFYQMKLYECIRSVRISTTALVANAGNIEILENPTAEIYSIFVNAVKFQVYARLAGGLTDEWRLYFGIKNTYSESSQGKSDSPEGRLSTDLGPEDIYPTDGSTYMKKALISFNERMRDLKGGLYGANAKVNTFASDGSRQSGKDVLTQYFELWMYGEHWRDPINEYLPGSWMHHFGGDRWYSDTNKALYAKKHNLLAGKISTYKLGGISHEQSGLTDTGILSIDDSVYNLITDFEWYTELEKYLGGDTSAKNQRWGDSAHPQYGDLDEEMVNYIWGGEAWGRMGPTVLGAQEEIFESMANGDYTQTANDPWKGPNADKKSGDIVIGIDNNAGLDNQIYLPWFPVAANISWGSKEGISRKRELRVKNIRFPVFSADGSSVDSTNPLYIDIDRKPIASIYKTKTLSALDDTRQVFEGDEYSWYPYGIEKLAWGKAPVYDDVAYSTRGGNNGFPLGRNSNVFT